MQSNKENLLSNADGCQIDPVIYDKLLESEEQLTKYLKYIRYKQPVPKIQLDQSIFPKKSRSLFTASKKTGSSSHGGKSKKDCKEIYPFLERYLALVREVSCMENSMNKKITKKTLQFLEEFPTMAFLVEVVNSFGKEKKKLCIDEPLITGRVNDDMVPLFEKIIERIEWLKREAEGKKLSELGHRIEHLQILIDSTKGKVKKSEENEKIFRTFESDRIEKYLLMEENISKAEKNYGRFSQNFVKNREVFSNINRVCLQIKSTNAD